MDLSYIKEFEKFANREVAEAVEELEYLEEASRKHLQKLVYTNLVDRFDVMIDKTILENALEENLLEETLNKLDSPVSESDVLKLLMNGNDIHEIVQERVQNVIRNSVLRNRHSLKLRKLFEILGKPEHSNNKPRVNISTGKILQTFTPQNNKVPASICGYSDWLYSRRNALVHGGGNGKISENDLNQLKKLYNAEVVKSIRLKLSAITVTTEFYLGITKILKSNKS